MARRRTSPSALHAWRPVDDGVDHLMTHVCHTSRTPPSTDDSGYSGTYRGARLSAATVMKGNESTNHLKL